MELSDGHGYDAEFVDFYNAILKGDKVKYDFKEAYRDLEIILGAIKSSEMNKRVSFN